MQKSNYFNLVSVFIAERKQWMQNKVSWKWMQLLDQLSSVANTSSKWSDHNHSVISKCLRRDVHYQLICFNESLFRLFSRFTAIKKMAFVTNCWTTDLLLFLASIVVFAYLRFKLYFRYFWKKRNVPYLEPIFLLGNTAKATFIKSAGQIFQEIYLQNKDKKLLGIWFYSRPVLFVQDLQLMKNVLVKDFQHFHDRGIRINEKRDPLDGKF